MLFSSMIFLWGFLPAVLLLYFALPKCLRNFLLLLWFRLMGLYPAF